ncbi:MAG: hypothetical protein RMK30_02945 [Anaerolineae bacterium]|nr:DUF169 domain-containing protein [Anaerolineae bacterium]MDW8101812.1 hypothetical protein [Anaerolineae bacterium]
MVGVKVLSAQDQYTHFPIYQGVSYCDAVRLAGEGQMLKVLPGSIKVCRWSPVVLGFKEARKPFELRLSPRLQFPTTGFLLGPLEDFPVDPEIVIIRTDFFSLRSLIERAGREWLWCGHGNRLEVSANNLMTEGQAPGAWLITAVNKALSKLAPLRGWQSLTRFLFRSYLITAGYEAVISRTLADMSLCRNSTVIPLLTGRVNVSFFCTGGINWGMNNPDHLTSGWPWEVFTRLRR